MKIIEKKNIRLTVFEVCLLACIAACLLTGVLAHRTQTELADRVVRLHVLANSDSEEDQAQKLLVRDAVLVRAEELLRQSADREEAERRLREQLPDLRRIAEETLRSDGCGYSVRVELEDTEFPTREYEGFTLPAGNYLALRVLIGDAAGQNWWCVVFPPLCAAVTAEMPQTALAAGLSEEQVRLITGEEGYVLKFKAVEFWEELRRKWNE